MNIVGGLNTDKKLIVSNSLTSNGISSSSYYGDGSGIYIMNSYGPTGSTGPTGEQGPTGSPDFSYTISVTGSNGMSMNTFAYYYSNISGTSFIANVLRGHAVYINSDITFNQYRFRTGATQGNIIFGIYKFENKYPTDLVWSGDVIEVIGSGDRIITITTTSSSIQRGLYLISHNMDIPIGMQFFTGGLNILGETTDGASNNQLSVGYTYSGYLPSVFPEGATPVTNLAVRLQFKII